METKTLEKVELVFKTIFVFCIFFLGFASSILWNEHVEEVEILEQEINGNFRDMCYTNLQPSPFISADKANMHKFNYQSEEFTLDFSDMGLRISSVTPSGSMRPGIPDGAILLLVDVFNESDVHVGDVISLKRENDKKNLLHRVVNITNDGNGTMYITKGDNNRVADKRTWRFEDIKDKLVGVLW